MPPKEGTSGEGAMQCAISSHFLFLGIFITSIS